jgi:hypothetical protein
VLDAAFLRYAARVRMRRKPAPALDHQRIRNVAR